MKTLAGFLAIPHLQKGELKYKMSLTPQNNPEIFWGRIGKDILLLNFIFTLLGNYDFKFPSSKTSRMIRISLNPFKQTTLLFYMV